MNEVADRRDRQRLRRFASGGVEGFGQTGPDDPAKRIIVGCCGHPCGVEHHVPHSREDAEAEWDGSGLEADGLSLSRGPAVGSKTRERLEEPVEDLGLELGEPVLIGRRCKQGGFLGFTETFHAHVPSVKETAREGSSAVNRYSSAALTGDFGALQTVLAYEFQNYKSFGTAEHEDGQIVYLGGNYDCGFAKTFIMGQYFKGIKAGQLTAISDADGVKGYGVHLGTIVPVAGGDLTVAAYFTDFSLEYATGDEDAKSYAFGAKYEYYLSKRTSVYTGAGFAQVKYDDDGSDKTTQAYLGLTHRF